MQGRILIVVNEPWFFLSHRLPIAQKAKSSGYEVHIATREGPGVDSIRSQGFIHHPIPFERSSFNVIKEIRTLVSLVGLYRTIRPHLVHHVTIKPVIYGSLVALSLRIPAVINAISGLGYIFTSIGILARVRRFFVVQVYRLILGRENTWVIFQNPDDQSLFVDNKIIKKEKTVLIRGSGVDISKFIPSPEPPGFPVVVLIARMLWDKGVGEFVEAAKLLQQRGIEATFLLVGDVDLGNPHSICRKQLSEWCDSGVVKWIGYCSDVARILSESHIMCLPSYREGLPKTLIEAAASARPIVTTDVPGCREVVIDGVNGYLVPPRNYYALADALANLINNPELRVKMGGEGRSLAVDEFAVERIVRETLALYDMALAE